MALRVDWQFPAYELMLTQTKEGGILVKRVIWWEVDELAKYVFERNSEPVEGTLYGCSKEDRVAFLIDLSDHSSDSTDQLASIDKLPLKFLKGKQSPEQFALELQSQTNLSTAVDFHLVVADLSLKTMYFIKKMSGSSKIRSIKKVNYGSHSISENGLDHPCSRITPTTTQPVDERIHTLLEFSSSRVRFHKRYENDKCELVCNLEFDLTLE